MLKSERGFTLIEILAAFVIVTVAAVPLARMMAQGNFLAIAAGKKTTALYLAQEKMEEITANGQAVEAGITPFPGEFSDYSYKVDTFTRDQIQLVTVTVVYPVSGQEKEVELSAVLPGGG